MKRLCIVSATIAALTCAALSARSLWNSSPPTGHSEYREGELDESGRLVILTGPRGGHKSLDYDYAVWAYYDSDVDPAEYSSAPPDSYTIELYSQPDRKIWKARTVAAFQENLLAIPGGSTLYRYNGSCGMPPFQDQAILDQISKACANRKLKLEDSEFSICNCPAW